VDRLSIDRDQFVEELQKRGIGVSVHYIPLHIMSYYRDRYGLKPEDYPASLACYQTCLSLPLYPSLTDEDVETIISAVVEVGETRHA
jgi:dTDP-4-amino-4,6-dideoxygalactose transaminase